jgi:signal transduction histidine kinase
MVLQAAGRARELVRQILTFSRSQDYERVALQLGPVFDTAIALLRSSLPRSVEITTRLAIPEALVLANETQLHQIIMNLGTNAYHAMGEAGGVLAIDLKRVEIDLFDEKSHSLQLAPGKYLLLRICDNGCGMERGIVDKIFDPYFTTKPKERGTGLGLAVVHGIVKSHGATSASTASRARAPPSRSTCRNWSARRRRTGCRKSTISPLARRGSWWSMTKQW